MVDDGSEEITEIVNRGLLVGQVAAPDRELGLRAGNIDV